MEGKAALKEIVMELIRATPVALFAGIVVLTVVAGPGSFFASFLQPATNKMDNNDPTRIVFENFLVFILFCFRADIFLSLSLHSSNNSASVESLRNELGAMG